MHEYKGLDTTSTVTRASHASLAYSFIISIAKKEAKMGGQCHQFQGNFKALKLFTNPRVDMYISTTGLIKPPLQTFEAFLVVQKYLLALSSIGPSGLKLNHVNKMGPDIQCPADIIQEYGRGYVHIHYLYICGCSVYVIFLLIRCRETNKTWVWNNGVELFGSTWPLDWWSNLYSIST